MNDLSEKVNFDSEISLAFEMQPFKVAFFVSFNANFSKYSRAEWVGNSIALSKNPKKAVFLKFLLNVSFTNESDKKRTFKSLTLSSLTLCARGVAVKSTGGFRG